MGCGKIAAVFGETAEGDQYAEIQFANAGMLYGSIGGQNTSNIQVRINADDWQPFDESQHFSFAANSEYVDWDKVTIYHQGVLVWGVEPGGNTADMGWHNPPDSGPPPNSPPPSGAPAPITPTLSLQYFTEGKVPVANYINAHLKLVNGGVEAVQLSNVTIRYWFSESAESFAACDYAVINCANIGVVSGPDYFELHFAANAALLPPSANSGNMQLRFHKNDWSSYDQSTHYSYNPAFNSHTNWQNITVYYNGLLVWGVEP